MTRGEPSPVLVGVFGDPVAHSLSPAMHNAAFRAVGIAGVYMKFRVPPARLGAALRAAAALGFRGVNLTIPHKARGAALVSRLTSAARRCRSVNTITFAPGGWLGDSTDGEGFLRSLRDAWGFRARGARVVMLGAGGAARAVAFALLDAGARELVVVNRTRARGAALVRALGGGRRARVQAPGTDADWADLLRGATLLVNATSLGMRGESSPVPASAMRAPLRVVDLVYHPPVTALLRAARRAGRPALNRAGMLVHQGAHAFTRWPRRRAPVPAMRQALRRALREE